jgi:hypothetical protein
MRSSVSSTSETVDVAARRIRPTGLIAEVAYRVVRREDVAERVVGRRPGQGRRVGTESADDVGVLVDEGQAFVAGGVDTSERAAGITAVGVGAVGRDIVG